jgi:hypothetical protein
MGIKYFIITPVKNCFIIVSIAKGFHHESVDIDNTALLFLQQVCGGLEGQHRDAD